jgi:transglutaminase-like putative cysteine protease
MPIGRAARGPLRPQAPPKNPLPRDVDKLARFQRDSEHDSLDPRIIAFGSRLARAHAPDDYLGVAREIFRFVRDGIRYQPDADWVQDHSPAGTILDRGFGNCVCKTKLTVALLRAVGIEAEFVPVWEELRDGTGQWLKHVQLRLRFPGSSKIAGSVNGWIYGELTIKGAELTQNPLSIAPNPDTGKLPLSGGVSALD